MLATFDMMSCSVGFLVKLQGCCVSEEIKSLIKQKDKYTIGIRLYAVYQVALGQSSRKLESLYNTSFKQITNWVHRFEQEGVNELRNKPKSVRKPKLDIKQIEEIKETIQNICVINY